VANLLKRLFQVEADFRATAAIGILNWGSLFLRACFWLHFEDPKRLPSLSHCFSPISTALRLEACLGACPFWDSDGFFFHQSPLSFRQVDPHALLACNMFHFIN